MIEQSGAAQAIKQEKEPSLVRDVILRPEILTPILALISREIADQYVNLSPLVENILLTIGLPLLTANTDVLMPGYRRGNTELSHRAWRELKPRLDDEIKQSNEYLMSKLAGINLHLEELYDNQYRFDKRKINRVFEEFDSAATSTYKKPRRGKMDNQDLWDNFVKPQINSLNVRIHELFDEAKQAEDEFAEAESPVVLRSMMTGLAATWGPMVIEAVAPVISGVDAGTLKNVGSALKKVGEGAGEGVGKGGQVVLKFIGKAGGTLFDFVKGIDTYDEMAAAAGATLAGGALLFGGEEGDSKSRLELRGLPLDQEVKEPNKSLAGRLKDSIIFILEGTRNDLLTGGRMIMGAPRAGYRGLQGARREIGKKSEELSESALEKIANLWENIKDSRLVSPIVIKLDLETRSPIRKLKPVGYEEDEEEPPWYHGAV